MLKTRYLGFVVVLFIGLCQLGCGSSAGSSETEDEDIDGLNIETGIPLDTGGGDMRTVESSSDDTTSEESGEWSGGANITSEPGTTTPTPENDDNSLDGPVLQPPQNNANSSN